MELDAFPLKVYHAAFPGKCFVWFILQINTLVIKDQLIDTFHYIFPPYTFTHLKL